MAPYCYEVAFVCELVGGFKIKRGCGITNSKGTELTYNETVRRPVRYDGGHRLATDGHEVGVITLVLALSTTYTCSRSPRSCGCSAPQFTRSEISDTESPLIGVAGVPSR